MRALLLAALISLPAAGAWASSVSSQTGPQLYSTNTWTAPNSFPRVVIGTGTAEPLIDQTFGLVTYASSTSVSTNSFRMYGDGVAASVSQSCFNSTLSGGNACSISDRAARGTLSAPTAVKNGDTLATWFFRGFGPNGFGGANANVNVQAVADFTATNTQTNFFVNITSSNATAANSFLQFTTSGTFSGLNFGRVAGTSDLSIGFGPNNDSITFKAPQKSDGFFNVQGSTSTPLSVQLGAQTNSLLIDAGGNIHTGGTAGNALFHCVGGTSDGAVSYGGTSTISAACALAGGVLTQSPLFWP